MRDAAKIQEKMCIVILSESCRPKGRVQIILDRLTLANRRKSWLRQRTIWLWQHPWAIALDFVHLTLAASFHAWSKYYVRFQWRGAFENASPQFVCFCCETTLWNCVCHTSFWNCVVYIRLTMYINLQDLCCIPVCCVCAEYWIIKVQCLVLLGVPIIHGLTLKMHVFSNGCLNLNIVYVCTSLIVVLRFMFRICTRWQVRKHLIVSSSRLYGCQRGDTVLLHQPVYPRSLILWFRLCFCPY